MQIRTCAWMLGLLSVSLSALEPVALAEAADGKLALAPLKSKKLPGAVTKALESGDYAAVQKAVAEALKGKEITHKDAEAVHLGMLHELIRVTGSEVMTAYAAEDKEKCEFLEKFVTDAEWLELYMTCGLVPWQKKTGVDVLYRIWVEEKGKVQNKALAVALASCWGGGETWQKPAIETALPNKFNPVRRYKFFQKQEKKGLLHPNYPNLKPWELRFVVANPGQDWDDASYEFAAKAINLPWDKYGIACWAATYTGTSKFGDSVQGGAYNLPYANESWAEATLRNGGVCGAMSHLGAVAAMAHGIPAYTCGQPGHCAYAVRTERGKWVGGFGGPDGGMHNMIFGHQAPTSYNLMEAVFADDKKVARAYRKSFCARALEAIGKDAEAEKMWGSALKDSPLHPFFRAPLHALMLKRGVTPDECHDYLVKEMLPHYDGHGVAAMNAAADLAEVVNQLPEKKLLHIYKLEQEALATTPSSWAVKLDELVQKQAESLQKDSARQTYLTDMFTAHMQKGDGTTFGQLLEWAVKTYVATEEGSKLFNKAFAKAAESAGGGAGASGESAEERNKKMQTAYNKAIVAAAQARSAPAFQALTKGALALSTPDYKADPLQKMGELKGKPAKGVLMRISTTSNYDAPMLHAGIMTPEGGKCHTAKEQTPTFIVELQKPGHTTGCIIRKTNGNEGRMKKAVVSTSEDGATWFKRAEIDNMPKEWVARFPDGTRAKWVKLEFENAHPDFAHISHFVTFTR
ncbi:MAG: hypothetical protein IKV13_02885 [Akkermansia sp.]|nr:hypothetical protein [Akkermansia sp.]